MTRKCTLRISNIRLSRLFLVFLNIESVGVSSSNCTIFVSYFSCLATVVWFDINGIRVDESISPRLRPPSLNGIIEEMANPLGKMRILWTEVVSAQEDDNNKMQVDSVIDKSAGDGTNGPQDKERKEVSQRR